MLSMTCPGGLAGRSRDRPGPSGGGSSSRFPSGLGRNEINHRGRPVRQELLAPVISEQTRVGLHRAWTRPASANGGLIWGAPPKAESWSPNTRSYEQHQGSGHQAEHETCNRTEDEEQGANEHRQAPPHPSAAKMAASATLRVT